MTRRLLVTAALIVAFGAFFLSNPPAPHPNTPTAHHRPTLGLGLIEHRGQFYRFEDLMNPEYRAASSDPFVQSFAEQRHYAEPWAGKGGRQEKLSDRQMRRQEIWRSQRIIIDIHDLDARQKRMLDHLPWAGSYDPIDDP